MGKELDADVREASETRPAGNEKFLGMRDYHDLYRKCCYDLDRLKALLPPQQRLPEGAVPFRTEFPRREDSPAHDREIAYTLFDLALGLNHLFDWVLGDPKLDPLRKAKCVEGFNPYRDKREAKARFDRYKRYLLPTFPPTTHLKQAMVKDIADGLKHFAELKKAVSVDAITRFGTQVEGGVEGLMIDTGSFVANRSFWVFEEDGTPIGLPPLCEELVREWGEFVEEGRPK